MTDQTFATEIFQSCTFDRKKEIPYRHIYVHMAYIYAIYTYICTYGKMASAEW